MTKRILLSVYNYRPEPTGIGKYNGEMIEWFVDQGYDRTVPSSYPNYPHWKVQELAKVQKEAANGSCDLSDHVKIASKE